MELEQLDHSVIDLTESLLDETPERQSRPPEQRAMVERAMASLRQTRIVVTQSSPLQSAGSTETSQSTYDSALSQPIRRTVTNVVTPTPPALETISPIRPPAHTSTPTTASTLWTHRLGPIVTSRTTPTPQVPLFTPTPMPAAPTVVSIDAGAYIQNLLQEANLSEEPVQDPERAALPTPPPQNFTANREQQLWDDLQEQRRLTAYWMRRYEHEVLVSQHLRRRSNLLQHHLALQYIHGQQLQAENSRLEASQSSLQSSYRPPPPPQD